MQLNSLKSVIASLAEAIEKLDAKLLEDSTELLPCLSKKRSRRMRIDEAAEEMDEEERLSLLC